MELGKQSYTSIMNMPVDRLNKYLNWKIKYDTEINKIKSNNLQ